METEKILQADVLDLVFEHKNKAYGAYTLRKFYHKRMVRSLLLMLGIVVVFSAFAILPGKKEKPDFDTGVVSMGNVAPDKPKEEPPKAKPKAKTQLAAQDKLLSTIRIENNKRTDTLKTLDSAALIGSVTMKAPVALPPVVGIPAGPGSPGDPIPDPAPEPAMPDPDPGIPITNPDVEPGFPGGMQALTAFMQRHLQNPRDLEAGEMVAVKIRFVVGYDGKLQSFETVQDGGDAFNREVIRVLKKMPDWIPGKTRGQKVAVYYTLPVKFVVQE